MNIKPLTRFIIAFASLFVFISLLQGTYAKYVTKADANTNMTIARWSITVNNKDIVNNNNFSDTIVPIFNGNQYTSSNVIAPNSEGYFDLVIDHSSVDVAFQETINLSLSQNNTITDLKILGYSIDNSEIIYFTDTTIISQNIALNPTAINHTYRIYIKWYDGAVETMNNESDTNATINGVASLEVNVSFIQVAS